MGKGSAEKFVEQEEKRGKASSLTITFLRENGKKSRAILHASSNGCTQLLEKKKKKEEQKEKIGVNYAISIV